jgi:hypothetical protein
MTSLDHAMFISSMVQGLVALADCPRRAPIRALSHARRRPSGIIELITLHAAWRATGDQTLLERHLETVEGCLSWFDNYGDRDGDGFQEYQTRSPVGYENMAWKDSGDSVVYPELVSV